MKRAVLEGVNLKLPNILKTYKDLVCVYIQ